MNKAHIYQNLENLKFAIIGFGRMGKLIFQLLQDDLGISTNNIVLIDPKFKAEKFKTNQNNVNINNNLNNITQFTIDNLDYNKISKVDIFIEFSNKDYTKIYKKFLKELNLENKIFISGSTGWDISIIQELPCFSKNIFFHSANFSLGIFVLKKLLEFLGKNDFYKFFDLALVEYHHNKKKDNPSGTLIMLQKIIQQFIPNFSNLTGIRVGNEIGKHLVVLDREYETITLSHQARDRKVFAKGVIDIVKLLIEQKDKLPKGKFLGFEDLFVLT